MSNQSQHPFTWRHFQSAIILLCIRWYVRYFLSYRDLEQIMLERGRYVGCRSIIQQSTTGSNDMHLSLSGVVVLK